MYLLYILPAEAVDVCSVQGSEMWDGGITQTKIALSDPLPHCNWDFILED